MFNDFDILNSFGNLGDADKALSPLSPSKGDADLFSQWMGKGVGNKTKSAMSSSTQLTSLMMERVPAFETNGSFNFSVYFPDGAKASVTVNNQPHRMSVTVATRSNSLAKKLKSSKKRTEEELKFNLKKPVKIDIISNG